MTTPVDRVPLLCSQRLTVVVLAFFGKLLVYSARVNLPFAILCMVRSDVISNTTSIGQDDYRNGTNMTSPGIGLHGFESVDERGEFDWSKSVQSQLLAMYFYGYVLTQVIGGWMSSNFGARRVWGISQLVSSMCTLLTPLCARTHVYLAFANRFILGFVAGVTFPSVHALLGRWAPPLERSKMVSYTFTGPSVGLVVTLATSGLLCEYGFDNGWGSIFYLCGIFNLLWVVVWMLVTADGPEKHKRITERERVYILNAIGKGVGKENKKIPWLKMLKSKPVWATIIGHMSNGYTISTLLNLLPMFMKESLQFDIKQNGLLSSLPFITQAIGNIAFGYIADKLIEIRWLSVKNTRKLMQTISNLGTGAMFCIAVQMDVSRRYVVVALLCVASMLNSACRGGYATNHLDLAPRYSGILFGITNTLTSLPAMAAPIVAGALTPNKTLEEWQNVFYVCSAIGVVCCIAFVLMADGEIQSWALDDEQEVVLNPQREYLMEDKGHNSLGKAEGNSIIVNTYEKKTEVI